MRISSEIWDTKFIVGKRGVFSKVCRRERGYGYKNVPIADETRKGSFGKPALIGVKQEVIPEQAEVVEQIMEMRAMGLSFGRICQNLKAAGIAPPRNTNKAGIPAWYASTIPQVTLNELYRGCGFGIAPKIHLIEPKEEVQTQPTSIGMD